MSRAVRAHRHRPDHAARQPRAPGCAHRALAGVVRRHCANAPTRATCSCSSTAATARRTHRPRTASSASARSRRRSDCKRALVQLPRRHAGARVARARRLHGRADAVPRQRPHRAHASFARCSSTRRYRHGKNGVLLAKSRLLFIAEFAQLLRAEDHRRIARPPRRRTARARSGKDWAAISSRWSIRRADYLTGIGQKAFIAELMPQAPGLREPAAGRRARRDRRSARGHAAGARDARAGRLSLRGLRRHFRRRPHASNAFATTSTRCASRRCCR
mgnify:CR=1 FL=1